MDYNQKRFTYVYILRLTYTEARTSLPYCSNLLQAMSVQFSCAPHFHLAI
jgi:hypothetical protein